MAGTNDNDGDDGIISGINVTPLVDVVLVLLIIFIVTASFLLRSSIDIELPRAATAEEAAPGLMIVGIDKGGQLYINGRKATIDDLPAAVAEARAKQSDPKQAVGVFVSADIGASYGKFAEVVDRLRLEGVTEISMDTKPVEGAARATPPEEAAGAGSDEDEAAPAPATEPAQ